MPILILFLTVAVFAREIPAGPHILSGCRVYTRQGNLIRIFPGEDCVFLEGGNLLTKGRNTVSILSPPFGSKLWVRPSFARTRIDVNSADEVSLSLPSDPAAGLAEIHPRISELARLRLFQTPDAPGHTYSAVPPQQEYSLFRHGEIAANVEGQAFEVRSKDLMRIIFTWKQTGTAVIRAARVNPLGQITYLRVSAESTVYEEYDPRRKRVVYQFPSPADKSFHIPAGGDYFTSGDDLVITDPVGGTYFFSRKTGLQTGFVPETHFDSGAHWAAERSLLLDLSEVLRAWY